MSSKDHTLLLPYKTVHGAFELARRDTPAVLYGETGMGKEYVARLIHRNSSRYRYPFVPVNLEQINRGVFESELFGHEKGAFTGADATHGGRFEAAGQGVLFLDEFTLALNSGIEKLMRVLESGVFYRVGSTKERRFSGRLLLGMNRHPKALLEAGLISKDIYYRINRYPLYIPPLRSRREQILPLVRKFLDEGGNTDVRLAPGDEEFLMRHSFPGNVRELKNLVEHALIATKSGHVISLEQSHIMLELVEGGEDSGAGVVNAGGGGNVVCDLDEFEKSTLSLDAYCGKIEAALIEQALYNAHNNISKAARSLKVCESTLRSKIKRLNISAK